MASSNPAVSVILPTYNRASLLRDSIESVTNQTFENFELIVVDDASTDDTWQTVEDIDDDRITYLRHDENRGAPAARNTGLAEATGDIIAFQDSDDEWAPTKLEKQMQLFRQSSTDVGVVYTGMMRTEQSEERYLPYADVEETSGDIRRSLARRNFISTPVAAVRAVCFDEVGGFDEDLSALNDWELWIRISQGYEFEFVDEALVLGEVRPDSISSNQQAKVRAREHIVNKHWDYFEDRALSRQLFYIGHGFMKINEGKKGRQYLKQAVKNAPNLINMSAIVLSYLGPSLYNGLYQYCKSASSGSTIAGWAVRYLD